MQPRPTAAAVGDIITEAGLKQRCQQLQHMTQTTACFVVLQHSSGAGVATQPHACVSGGGTVQVPTPVSAGNKEGALTASCLQYCLFHLPLFVSLQCSAPTSTHSLQAAACGICK
jgi:hypothetical protein